MIRSPFRGQGLPIPIRKGASFLRESPDECGFMLTKNVDIGYGEMERDVPEGDPSLFSKL